MDTLKKIIKIAFAIPIGLLYIAIMLLIIVAEIGNLLINLFSAEYKLWRNHDSNRP